MARIQFEKNRVSYVSVACIIILFTVFATVAMTLLVIGADTYKGIKKNIDVTFNSGALMSYIENKVHNYNSGNITLKQYDEYDVLVLYEKQTDYKTYIYCYKNQVYENLVSSDIEFVLGEGEKLYQAESLEFEEVSDTVLKVCVNENSKEQNKVSYISVSAGFSK